MAKRPPLKAKKVHEVLVGAGFPSEFARTITDWLDTDFVAGQMLGYLNQARPRRQEDIVDELLCILERRERIKESHIRDYERRKRTVDDLFLRGFTIHWNDDLIDGYVGRIPALRGLRGLEFTENITFFVGENGSGKSTLLEALAVSLGLNAEGGTKNYCFETYNDVSPLAGRLSLVRGTIRPEWSYFLRAESFFNVATAAMREYNEMPGKPMPDYHSCSHGESFLDFIQKNDSVGLYLMDEPEAALSPQRQLTLLIHLVQMAKKGSQFLIATHSPILLGIPDAEILSFDEGSIEPISYEETESYRIMKAFLGNRQRFLKELLEET